MSRPATGDGEPEFEACPVSDEPLERPEQLPEVPGDRVLIDWSMEGRRTVLLRCGKREIWRQRTFTNARELTAVFEICRARYGRRFAGIRLDDNAKAAIVDCFAGQEVIDYLKASLEPDPSCPATRFPIDRTSEVSEAPPGWRRRWFGVSDSFFLSFSCAPSGLIEVHLLDTSDDLTDHSRRFLVDGAALLQDLLEQQLGPDPDEAAFAAFGAEMGFDPAVWQDVAVTLLAVMSRGRVDDAHAIAEKAGAIVTQ